MCSPKISFITKLHITYDKSLTKLLTFMYILKENKVIFITTKKQKYTEININFSTPHSSNQILILYKSYEWVKLQLCQGIWVSLKLISKGALRSRLCIQLICIFQQYRYNLNKLAPKFTMLTKIIRTQFDIYSTDSTQVKECFS